MTMLTTPAGRPAAWKISIKIVAVQGVLLAGLNTTVLPLTMAGAIFQMGMATGKFQGVMIPTTPSGCLMV